MPVDFAAQLRADADQVAAQLDQLIVTDAGPATRLIDSMQYATMNGGKRMRAALVMGAARLAFSSRGEIPDPTAETGMVRAAAALEALHAYSLVHDDVPAMDDAETRRGKASAHIAFDEATAILAGDALQTLAFDILADPQTHADGNVRAELVLTLARASGVRGMAGGQMLDLQAEATTFSLDQVKEMQAMKTGALIHAAALCGGIVGGADVTLRAALSDFSRDLGLAFQIADDLLDYQGDEGALGKPTGQDAERGKGSFVTLMGLAEARTAAARLIEDADAALAPWGADAEYLQSMAAFAIARKS